MLKSFSEIRRISQEKNRFHYLSRVARRRFASVNKTRNSTGMDWDYEDKCCFA
jgi:hypothetical protein